MCCNPTGALSITIFAPQSVKLKTPADLVGKRVRHYACHARGGDGPKDGPEGTKIVWFDDLRRPIPEAALGQVDAAAMTAYSPEDGCRTRTRASNLKQIAGDDRVLRSDRAAGRLRAPAVDQHTGYSSTLITARSPRFTRNTPASTSAAADALSQASDALRPFAGRDRRQQSCK